MVEKHFYLSELRALRTRVNELEAQVQTLKEKNDWLCIRLSSLEGHNQTLHSPGLPFRCIDDSNQRYPCIVEDPSYPNWEIGDYVPTSTSALKPKYK